MQRLWQWLWGNPSPSLTLTLTLALALTLALTLTLTQPVEHQPVPGHSQQRACAPTDPSNSRGEAPGESKGRLASSALEGWLSCERLCSQRVSDLRALLHLRPGTVDRERLTRELCPRAAKRAFAHGAPLTQLGLAELGPMLLHPQLIRDLHARQPTTRGSVAGQQSKTLTVYVRG